MALQETMLIPRPADTGLLVIIAEENVTLLHMDSSFIAFNSATSFGSGMQRLVVPKTYWAIANPTTGANLSKCAPVDTN